MMGLSTEPKQELMDTVNFPTHLDPKSDEIGVRLTIPSTGSIIFNVTIEGIKLERYVMDKWIGGNLVGYFSKGWPTYIPDGLTRKEMQDAMARVYRFLCEPTIIFKRFLTNMKSCARSVFRIDQIA
jgi:hypothetical protein